MQRLDDLPSGSAATSWAASAVNRPANTASRSKNRWSSAVELGVGPLDRGPQAPVPSPPAVAGPGQRVEVAEPGQDLGRGHRPGAGGGDLQGQGHAVEGPAQVATRRQLVVADPAAGLVDALAEQAQRRHVRVGAGRAGIARGPTTTTASPGTSSGERLVARTVGASHDRAARRSRWRRRRARARSCPSPAGRAVRWGGEERGEGREPQAGRPASRPRPRPSSTRVRSTRWAPSGEPGTGPVGDRPGQRGLADAARSHEGDQPCGPEAVVHLGRSRAPGRSVAGRPLGCSLRAVATSDRAASHRDARSHAFTEHPTRARDIPPTAPAPQLTPTCSSPTAASRPP